MNKEMKDPRKIYRMGNENEIKQDSPVLQKNMKINPDCGEETYKGNNRLTNRNALITGGDSGIGRAVAIAFAREGSNVAIQYLPNEEADAKEVEKYIKDTGQKSLLLPYDFREDNAATEIVEKTIDEFNELDILVLNAGQQFPVKSLDKLNIKQVTDTFKVNIISMFETVKAAERYLEPGSSIITTTSVQSFNPSPSMIDYAATKAAINNFTINLSNYFANDGVRVNAVAPGPIWTPIQLFGEQLDEGISNFGEGTLLQRAGQPVELSSVYVLLASEEGSYITGQIYGITGGEPINL